MNEVPTPLRKRLEDTTGGANAATILIADSKGKEELVRAIQGVPGSVPFRVARRAGKRRRQQQARELMRSWRTWLELGVILLAALLVWMLVIWK